ncbi:MAG: HAD family hydrolase [Pseudomonadota bacterium]
MSYDAIVFDLDGTLLNTLNDLGNAVNRVLSQHGFPTHNLDKYRYFVGDGAKMLVIRALPEHQRNEKVIDTCLQDFKNDYGQHWNVDTRLYDGIPDMLDKLSSRRIKLAILSNKPHEFTIRCVTKFLSKWTFDVVLGQQESIPLKPHPAAALGIADRMNMPVSSFLYLGDTAVDMQTAVAAGMFPVGAMWGFRSPEELKENGAKVLLQYPSDIFTLLT